MAFVTHQRWAARYWHTEALGVVDGRAEARLSCWDVPVCVRLISACGQAVVNPGSRPYGNGREFDITPGQKLRWTMADSLAPLETQPGELAHLAEFGVHLSACVVEDWPIAPPIWRHDLIVPAGTVLAYQSELTPEELAEGCVRPPAVVGSYAVFDAQGCKIAHIPRPCAVDANGARLWGTIAILERAAGILDSAVSFQQQDLKLLVYPITIYGVDTFGYTSVGGSFSGIVPDQVWAAKSGSPAADGNATSVSMYFGALSDTPVTLGFYDTHASDYPLNRQGDSAGAVESTNGWVTQNLDSPVAIVTTKAYWAAQNHDDDTIDYYYDTDAAARRETNDSAYVAGVLPDPHGGTTPLTGRKSSAYITYTPGGGAMIESLIRARQARGVLGFRRDQLW